jgi:hypothetical protein
MQQISSAIAEHLEKKRVTRCECANEKVKAQIRARVEHPFHVVKNLFRRSDTGRSATEDWSRMVRTATRCLRWPIW